MNAIGVYVLTILLVRILLEKEHFRFKHIGLIECVDKLELTILVEERQNSKTAVNEYLDQGMQTELPTLQPMQSELFKNNNWQMIEEMDMSALYCDEFEKNG